MLHTKSTHSRTQGRDLSHIYLLILESLLDSQEATGTHPRDSDTGWNHLLETILPMDTDGGKCHFANPSFSLLVLRVFPTY